MSKFKIYGYSDDNIVVSGMDNHFEDEWGCYEKPLVFTFTDGTQVKGSYGGDGTGCWRFEVLQKNEAAIEQTQTGDEDEGRGSDSDAPPYSDVLVISHESPVFALISIEDVA